MGEIPKNTRECSRVFSGRFGVPKNARGRWLILGETLRSRAFLGTPNLPEKIREHSRVFLGISPKSQPPRKKFGNVPECIWNFLKSAYANREHSRVFLGLLPRISPKVSLSEKNSGTFPSVFGGKVSLPGKKLQERSRVFRGLLKSPKGCLPEKSSGTFPSVSEELIQNSAFSNDNRERFQSQVLLAIASQNVARGCPPDENSGTFPSVLRNFTKKSASRKKLSWLSKCSWDLLR